MLEVYKEKIKKYIKKKTLKHRFKVFTKTFDSMYTDWKINKTTPVNEILEYFIDYCPLNEVGNIYRNISPSLCFNLNYSCFESFIDDMVKVEVKLNREETIKMASYGSKKNKRYVVDIFADKEGYILNINDIIFYLKGNLTRYVLTLNYYLKKSNDLEHVKDFLLSYENLENYHEVMLDYLHAIILLLYYSIVDEEYVRL